MTTRSTRSKTTKESVKSEAATDVPMPKNKKLKKSVEIQSAVLPLQVQNSILRTVLDRLDGKSVILHGIERTKS